MGEPSSGVLSPVRSPDDRLDSWKEIAAYFHRDVKTVQRWERREGMPVHRHLHDRIGSVYAFSSELDTWSQGRRLRLEEEEEERSAEPAADEEIDVRPTGTLRTRRLLVLGGLTILALFVAANVITGKRVGRAIPAKIKSLAVLPLKNLSGDPTQEYLADGITESLIGRLSRIHDLRVISRTSVMRFKDTKPSLPEIARTLGVDAIVEGSVI